MKKLLKPIKAAEETPAEERIKEGIGELDDTFSYILAGLEHLSTLGSESQSAAEEIIAQLRSGLNEFTQRIANVITE